MIAIGEPFRREPPTTGEDSMGPGPHLVLIRGAPEVDLVRSPSRASASPASGVRRPSVSRAGGERQARGRRQGEAVLAADR
jgi:hypothetical protein